MAKRCKFFLNWLIILCIMEKTVCGVLGTFQSIQKWWGAGGGTNAHVDLSVVLCLYRSTFLSSEMVKQNCSVVELLMHDQPRMLIWHSARRVGPHKEAEFSSQSIMKAMESFVDAVQDMEQTILVPSRLMDLKVGDESDTIDSKPKGTSTDLYRLYTMVNCVKNELLWGNNAPCEEEPPMTVVQPETVVKGHVRRPSTTSVASSQSISISDTDSETSAENDSGIEGETDSRPDFVTTAELSFRRHLHGLQRSLAQMTTAASYLTKRYQNDIGATV